MGPNSQVENLMEAIANLEYLIAREENPETRTAYEAKLKNFQEQVANLQKASAAAAGEGEAV